MVSFKLLTSCYLSILWCIVLRWNIVGTEQLEEDNLGRWFWIVINRAHPRITEILLFLFFKLGFLSLPVESWKEQHQRES